jgi:signal transduction histidine kinase
VPPESFAARSIGARSAIVTPMSFRNRPVGFLIVFDDRPFNEEAERLLQAFAASAATAVATAQNASEEALRRGIEASEAERTRWARELHDETLQELGAVKVMLDAALRKERPEELETVLLDTRQTIASSIEGLRRMITELRPAALDELGVEAAVSALVERRRTTDLEVVVAVDLDWEAGRRSDRLAPEVESTVHRIVQEALTNISKHARAKHAQVTIVERDERVIVDVVDDGRGLGSSDTHGTGLGLIGMRERVALLGGRLDVESPPTGGTRVHATLPALRA